ncbi:hypothetical protein M2140_000076 [Clostridiales Family XIII bacterium PM5-7]
MREWCIWTRKEKEDLLKAVGVKEKSFIVQDIEKVYYDGEPMFQSMVVRDEVVLTMKEWAFCVFMETGWLVREKDGNVLYGYTKPEKHDKIWINSDNSLQLVNPRNTRNRNVFQFIKWEDEPWSVEELLKLEVEAE